MRRLPFIAVALSLTFVPTAVLAQQYKATQDPGTGVISVAGATRSLPIQLVSSQQQTDKKTQQTFEDAAVSCQDRYARIMDYRVYPFRLAECVRDRMHLGDESTLKVIPVPNAQYKN